MPILGARPCPYLGVVIVVDTGGLGAARLQHSSRAFVCVCVNGLRGRGTRTWHVRKPTLGPGS
eukprot:6431436-Prymnesium_polylepis.1